MESFDGPHGVRAEINRHDWGIQLDDRLQQPIFLQGQLLLLPGILNWPIVAEGSG